MTPAQTAPEHCEHECVCYHVWTNALKGCPFTDSDKICPHDTRTRPAPDNSTCIDELCDAMAVSYDGTIISFRVDVFKRIIEKAQSPKPPADALALLTELQDVVAHSVGEGIHKGWLLAYPIERWLAYQKKQATIRQQHGGKRE